MPFSISGFASLGQSPQGNVYAYRTDDALATVLARGYFTALRDEVRAGDRIQIQAASGKVGEVRVTSVGATVALVAVNRQPVRRQVITNRGLLCGTPITSANISSECSIQVRNGMRPATNIQLFTQGFSVQTSGNGELAFPNSYTTKFALERASPNKIHLPEIRGVVGPATVNGGTGLVASEPMGMWLAANEDFRIQMGAYWNAGTYPAALNNPAIAGVDLQYRGTVITDATWQIGTLHASWVATSRAASSVIPCPTMMVGLPDENYPCVGIIGDSIGASTGEGNTAAPGGGGGFVARGLWTGDAAGGSVPYVNLSRAGETLAGFGNGGWAMRLAALPYVSHVICNLGTNDLGTAGSVTFAQMKVLLDTAWALLKYYNVEVYHVLLFPRTTSTSTDWTSAADQTAEPGFTVGGVRDQVNGYIRQAAADGTIAGFIDCNEFVEDPAAPSKWVSNGTNDYATADGTHPTSQGHLLAAAAVTRVARTFTMPYGLMI